VSRYIALDAEQGHLYLASVIVKGSAVKVEKAVSLPGMGLLTVANAVEYGGRVREAMKEAGIPPAPVLVSVGRERVVLKEVKYPATVTPAEEPALVRFQVAKELAEGGDSVVIDYFVLPMLDADGQRHSLAFAVRKDILNASRTACQAAGLKLAAITPRPFGIAASLQRAIKDGAVTPPESVESPMAVLARGDKWGELVLLRGGHVAFTRSLTGLALNSEAAMLGEIKRNLAVFASHSTQPVQALFVAEGDAPGGWSGRIRAGLSIPVQSFDPIAEIENDIPPEARGSFAGLAGIAYLRARSAELPVNFIEPREPKSDRDPNKRLFAIVGAAAALLLIGGLGIGRFVVSKKTSQAVALKMQKNELDDDLRNLEESVRRVKAVREWNDKGVNWLDELYDLTARFPDPKGTEVTVLIGQRLDSKNAAAAKYAADLELQVSTEGSDFINDLVKQMAQDKHYSVGAKQSKGTLSGAGGAPIQKNQQFTLKFNIARRDPSHYVLKLNAPVGTRERNRRPPPGEIDGGDDMWGGFGQFGGFQ
jgi:Tfp pilus assembly PilM family ATPase